MQNRVIFKKGSIQSWRKKSPRPRTDQVIAQARPSPPAARLYVLILVCFILSDLTALIYQIVWMRLISHVIGGAPFAVSTILAIFMAGLGIGTQVIAAAAHFRDALRIDPQMTDAMDVLALLLATSENPMFADPVSASGLAARAVELSGEKQPRYLATQAIALLRIGDAQSARSLAVRAEKLARVQNDHETLKRIEKYLAGVRERR